MRIQRAALIASVPLALLILGDARAADHSDGLIQLDVTQSLIEGPPYPAAPVEMDAAYRHPPAAAIPAGQILLSLESAQDGSAAGGDLPMMGTVVDNGDVFGEPGDQIGVDLRFISGSPPAYPATSIHEWVLRFPGGSGVTEWELREWRPSRPGQEQSYDADVVLRNALGTQVGAARLHIVFQVGAGQDLIFSNPSVIVPVASGPNTEMHLIFELNQTGGSVDPAEPIYSMSMTSLAIPVPALRSPYGPMVLGLLLLASAFAAHRVGRRRPS